MYWTLKAMVCKKICKEEWPYVGFFGHIYIPSIELSQIFHITPLHLLILKVDVFHGEVANLDLIRSNEYSIIWSTVEISLALNPMRKHILVPNIK